MHLQQTIQNIEGMHTFIITDCVILSKLFQVRYMFLTQELESIPNPISDNPNKTHRSRTIYLYYFMSWSEMCRRDNYNRTCSQLQLSREHRQMSLGARAIPSLSLFAALLLLFLLLLLLALFLLFTLFPTLCLFICHYLAFYALLVHWL